MKHQVAAVAILLTLTHSGWSCWNMIDPRAFAEGCPIIVAGAIVEVIEAAPGGRRSDDIAKIRIDAIHRNELTDLGLKVGDLLAVKMISRNNSERTSTDLNYPAQTKATWLVMLTSKGEYRIDTHPVQKQPYQLAPKFGRMEQRTIRASDVPVKLANPAGSKTKDEWIAWKKRCEAEAAKSLANHYAQQKAIRDLAKLFADAETLDDKVWNRLQAADVEIRRGILQLSIHEQPMTGARFAEVAQGTLLREMDDNVRTHAVSQLAYCRDPGAKGMEVLAAAMRDKSASVRLFACQSVKMRRYEQLIDQVKELRSDPDLQVREMAVHTLEFWREKSTK